MDKLAERSLTVGVFGLGYVGIPLSLAISEVGLTVLGFDVSRQRVDELNAGKSPIRHIPAEDIIRMRTQGFAATTDMSRAAECDVLIICVPTPLNRQREPDLSFVTATMDAIAPYLRKGQLVALESTTWPGTTDEILAPYFDRAGLTLGRDAFLVYSPEREDPGNVHFVTYSIPKVLGGVTDSCRIVGQAFYEVFIERVVPVSSAKAAELVKLLENIHRSVNIGLMNEMKVLTDRMGVDIFEIVDAAATKPFGFTPYYPGPGIGGHCIPIDPFYLTWKAREYGLHTRFIELAGEINASMPEYVVSRLIAALNESGKALKGSRVLALGIAYKRNVDDMRESPSVFVMERLRAWGAEVAYSDPHVPNFPQMREHDFDLSSVDLTPDVLADFDAVVVLTDHNDIDYPMILEHAPLLLDTRGRYRGQTAPNLYRA
ncbi:nucleotide sugar dehydrogenase [Roseinatronobacter monicus]|uniref:nucleotide sugar dehydrogenase n=1 Tax=Roseinatronobacter monicus TaxID=393481 RepID=UPI001FE481E8|nr:nucleotide sugar dehydrogenase [Roseinatronobacter monicus]